MNRIQSSVAKILDEWGGNKPPIPIEGIARSLGAKLLYEPFEEDPELSGMLYRHKNKIVIGINSSHHIHRQRFTIAHEIGHLVLHKGKMYVDSPQVQFRSALSSLAIDREEIEANQFAAEILMPPDFVISVIRGALKSDKTTREMILEKMANEFRVSQKAAELRLKNLGLILPE